MTEVQRAQFFAMRRALDGYVSKIADSPAEINDNPAAIRIWKPGAYEAGDVRAYGGIPYRCVLGHDSTNQPDWTPDATPALWMQYHGTTVETARAWVTPTGAHDMYRAGEFMIWTGGAVYRCVADTAYSPASSIWVWQV